MKEQITIWKLWRTVIPVAIYLGITVVISFAIEIVYMTAINPNYTKEDMYNWIMDYSLELTGAAAAITIPILLYLHFRDKKHEKLNNRWKNYEKAGILKYIWIIPLAAFTMYSANMFVSLLTTMMPQSMLDSYNATSEIINRSSYLLQVIVAVVFGPIVEELVFRVLMYSRIKRMFNIPIAAIVSSIAFGVFHWNWVQAPYAIIIGLVAIFAYEKYKNIVAPMMFHMCANGCSVAISYFARNSRTEGNVPISPQEYIITLTVITIITGLIAYGFGLIINKRVDLKEI